MINNSSKSSKQKSGEHSRYLRLFSRIDKKLPYDPGTQLLIQWVTGSPRCPPVLIWWRASRCNGPSSSASTKEANALTQGVAELIRKLGMFQQLSQYCICTQTGLQVIFDQAGYKRNTSDSFIRQVVDIVQRNGLTWTDPRQVEQTKDQEQRGNLR